MILDENLLEERGLLNVKLRGSGQIINLSRMPDEFIDVLHDVIAGLDDPYTKLAVWAYMFVGLSIDEIRERFIISEGTRVKHVSREYIRQKIKGVYEQIYTLYVKRYGSNTIATLFYNRYIHANNNTVAPDVIKEVIKEESVDENNHNTPEEDTDDSKEEGRDSEEEIQKEGADINTAGFDNWEDIEH